MILVIREPLHGEKIRSQLLSIAAKLFVRKGYDATTVRDIAAEAKVTTGSLYHFFENKEGLLDQLVRNVFIATEKMADEATRASSDPFLCASYELCMQLELISADGRLAAVYGAAHASAAISQHIVELALNRFRRLLETCVPEALVEPQAYRLAVSTKSLMTGLVQEKLALDRLSGAERRQILLAGMWSQVPIEVNVDTLAISIENLLSFNKDSILSILTSKD